MTIRAQLADGTVLEFPDDTPDPVIDRTVKSTIGAPQPAAPAKPGLWDAISHGAQTVLAHTPPATSPSILPLDQMRTAAGNLIDTITGQPQGQTSQAAGAAMEGAAGQFARLPADVGNLWRHRSQIGSPSGPPQGLAAMADQITGGPNVIAPATGPDIPVPAISRDLTAQAKADAPQKPGVGSQIASGVVGLAPYLAAGSVPVVGPGIAASMMAGAGVTDQAQRAEALGKAGTPQAYNAEAGNAVIQGALGVIPLGSLGAKLIPAPVKEAALGLAQRVGLGALPNWAIRGAAEVPGGVATGAAMQAGANLETQQSGLDPKQDIGAGVADSAGNMGVIAAILGAAHAHAPAPMADQAASRIELPPVAPPLSPATPEGVAPPAPPPAAPPGATPPPASVNGEPAASTLKPGEGHAGPPDPTPAPAAPVSQAPVDPYERAKAIVLGDGKPSTSYLQRKMGISFGEASALIQRMESDGLIGPPDAGGKRQILTPPSATPPEPVSASPPAPVAQPPLKASSPPVPGPATTATGGEAGGAARPVPASWPQGVPTQLFHGYGRPDKATAYNQVPEPILGAGRYLAFSAEHASEYGPHVETETAALKNPLLIQSDEQWRALTRRAGWQFAQPEGPEAKADIDRMRSMIMADGHDGVIIHWDDSGQGDKDPTSGHWIKTLRHVFDRPQVVDFGRVSAGTPKPEVAPPEPATRPPEPVAPPPLRPEPGPLAEGEKLVSTPAGNKVRTRFELAEASDLKPATGDLQNRDRTRVGTDLQVSHIVNGFDPTRLGDSTETDRGAPIVGPDNTVEVGNGRVAAINRVYDDHPDKAQAYQDHIRSLGLDPTGMRRPVLIRRRMTDMTPDQRRTFVHDSNKDAKLSMSTVETAKTDAASLDEPTMALYRGGNVEAAHNADFRKAFMSRLTPEEQGAMVGDDGRMNNHGVSRLENALMARAYEDPAVLTKLMEARDNNIRSIGGAMLDQSGAWATMRADAQAGRIKPEFDITRQLVQAAREVSDLRARGGNVRDYLDQQDAFNPRDPITEKLIRAFYTKGLNRAAGRDAIGDVLAKYADRASKQSTEPSLFGDDRITPADILDKIIQDRDATQQPNLFAAEDRDIHEDDEDATERAPGRDEGGDESEAGEDEGQARDSAGRNDSPAGAPGDSRPGGNGDAGPGDGGEAGGDRLDDRSGIDSPVRGAYGDTFARASFTDRPSIYESAIRDTGIDPDKFRLLPTGRQKALLVRAFTKKYGIKVEIDDGLQDRVAIDQLMDAHQNVQAMAHALGVSERAIGLGGKLTIRLLKKGDFLGAYEPSEGRILLPQRTNSFAHEWGHALDFHLLAQVSTARAKGLSGLIRAKGAEFEPSNVAEAFVHVLNSMFFDKTALAAKVMDLEKQIVATKSAKQKAALQAQIDNITRGTSNANARSNFFRGAKAMDKGRGDYWTSPTEMFARSFEAYVSNMAEAAGSGTEFIGKGDVNYRSDAEKRFALTFPKGEERDAIFDAIGKLMVQVNREQMLGADTDAAAAPGMGTLRRLTDFDHAVASAPHGGLLRQELDAWQRAARQRAEEKEGRVNDPKSLIQRANDIAGYYLYSMSGKLKMIAARYKSSAVKEIHDKLAWTPGKSEGTPRTFAEAADIHTKQASNRLANILKAHGLEDMAKPEYRTLRDLLISEATPAPAHLIKAAAAIRRLLDGEFYKARNAGIDLGYTTNGYLPRILDHPRIAFAENKFIDKAAEAYGHVFDRDYGADAGEVLGDDEKLSEFLKAAGDHKVAGVKEARKLLQQIKKFEADPANAGKKADDLRDQLRDLIDQMHPDVRDAWSKDRAEHWLAAMKTANEWEGDGAAPANGYTKSRELTPEADKILEDFYVQNPIEAVHSYIRQNARRVAYAERFGPNGEILKELTEKMAAQGVLKEDQNEVLKVVATATGRNQTNVSRSAQRFLSFVQAFGTITLLPRAVISSLAEPITAGITAGDFRVGFHALANSIVGSRSLDGKHRAELSRAMGIVADHVADHIAEARFGGQFGNETRFDRLTSTMFERSGLTALTRTQRAHMQGVAHAYLDNLSGRVLNVARDEAAMRGLKELGVRDPVAFAKQIRTMDRSPTVEELDTEFGHDYTTAAKRFTDLTIQEPNAMMRPHLANNPVGRIAYGITGFSSAFFRNVLQRQMNLTGEIAKAEGAGRAAAHVGLGFLPAAAALYAVTAITSTLREYLLNPGRWQDLENQGQLEATMAQLAFTRAFSFGIADGPIQAFTGLKYQHDLSNLMVGAAPSVMLDCFKNILMPLLRNSPKTNTSEYNATKAAYNLIVSPALATGLLMIPGGPVMRAVTGAAVGEVTSQAAGDTAATAAFGVKDGRHKTGRANDRQDSRQSERARTR